MIDDQQQGHHFRNLEPHRIRLKQSGNLLHFLYSGGKLHDAGIFRIQVVLSFAAWLGNCPSSHNMHVSTQAIRAKCVARSTSISHRSLTIRTRPQIRRGAEESTEFSPGSHGLIRISGV